MATVKPTRGDTLPVEVDVSDFTEDLTGVQMWLTVKRLATDPDNKALLAGGPKTLADNTNPVFVFGPGGDVGSTTATDNVPLDTELVGDVQIKWPGSGYVETWKGLKVNFGNDVKKGIV